MKFISLPVNLNDSQYIVSELTGDLLVMKRQLISYNSLDSIKLCNALSLCDNPYKLFFWQNISPIKYISKEIKIHARIIIFLSRINFFLAKQYASIKSEVFADSSEAISYFHSITTKKEMNNLCLPRTLFAAKTSKLFDNDGVIFIGVFLPSRSMHSWIIEKNIQPDPEDNIWHQFRPIAAIF
jgi:hypothetical protein